MRRSQSNKTILEAMDLFIRHSKNGRRTRSGRPVSKSTLDYYKRLRELYIEFTNKSVSLRKNESVVKNHLRKFVHHLTKVRPNSAFNDVPQVRSMIKYCIAERNIQFNSYVLDNLKAPKPRKEVFTIPREAIRSILKYRRKDVHYHKRHYLDAIHILAYTGLRGVDVCNLKRKDLRRTTKNNETTWHILTVNKKTNEITRNPIPKYLAQRLLDNYHKQGKILNIDRNNLSSNIRSVLHEMKLKLLKEKHTISGVDKDGKPFHKTDELRNLITPHMFRKTAVTVQLMNGESKEQVRKRHGFSVNSSAFERYVNVADEGGVINY